MCHTSEMTDIGRLTDAGAAIDGETAPALTQSIASFEPVLLYWLNGDTWGGWGGGGLGGEGLGAARAAVGRGLGEGRAGEVATETGV